VALAGVYSLPLLGPRCSGKLGVADERCLLLTIQDQSIRQSYLEKGELHFSRLSPLQNSSIGGIAQTFAAEARKLQQYLVSQRLLGRQQPISAYLLAHPRTPEVRSRAVVPTAKPCRSPFSTSRTARACGLKTLATGQSLRDRSFCICWPATRRAAQFASDQQRHDYHLWLVRSALRAYGRSRAGGCLLWSGKQFYDAYHLNQEVDHQQRNGAGPPALRRHRQDLPADSDQQRQPARVIDRYLELEKGSTSPDLPVACHQSRAAGAAAVELDGIDWKLSRRRRAPRAAGGDGEAQGYSRPPGSEIAIVRGTLRLGPDSNPRQVLASSTICSRR
jgi:hypothetical protein